MRSNRVNGYGAVVLSLALMLPAASAPGQVVNRNFTIQDAGEPDTIAFVNHTGASNSGTGLTTCRNGSNSVTVVGTTTHPESVRLVKNTAKLKQGGLLNNITLRVVGAGAQVFNVALSCYSAKFASYVNNASNVSAGKFKVQGGDCSGLTVPRANYLNDTCAADVDNKTIKTKIEGSMIEKLEIKGKGTAL